MASRSTAKSIVPVFKADAVDFEQKFEELMNRRQAEGQDVEAVVKEIVSGVRDGGDEQLRAFVEA